MIEHDRGTCSQYRQCESALQEGKPFDSDGDHPQPCRGNPVRRMYYGPHGPQPEASEPAKVRSDVCRSLHPYETPPRRRPPGLDRLPPAWRFPPIQDSRSRGCLTPFGVVASTRRVEHGGLARGGSAPLRPLGFPCRCRRGGGRSPPPKPPPAIAPMAVRRRSANRRSAIAPKPSPAILRASARGLLGVEGAEPLASPFVPTRDSPPFVNGVKGGAVTPHRESGRAGQRVAGRAGGCRPSIAPGRARKCSRPRSAPTLPRGAKGSTASPRRLLPGFEGATSLASPAVIPWVSCMWTPPVGQARIRDRVGGSWPGTVVCPAS